MNLNNLYEQISEDYSELSFSYRLRAIREARGISQRELADRVGVTPNYISNYERGINVPSIQLLEWICEALKVSASDLLGF